MAIQNRYDFIMLFDVENGNPNGDPDAGNSPRVDAETGLGYITDVCLKRKIRNYVELCMEGRPGYNILIKPDRALNTKFAEAYDQLGLKKENKGKNADDVKKAREYMCRIHAASYAARCRLILPEVCLRYAFRMLRLPVRRVRRKIGRKPEKQRWEERL